MYMGEIVKTGSDQWAPPSTRLTNNGVKGSGDNTKIPPPRNNDYTPPPLYTQQPDNSAIISPDGAALPSTETANDLGFQLAGIAPIALVGVAILFTFALASSKN